MNRKTLESSTRKLYRLRKSYLGEFKGAETDLNLCRNGVVYFYGTLPSQSEHQILLGILTDVLGLKEIVDRTGVDKMLWERPERSKREVPAVSLPWEEPEATDDLVECVEEGKEFSPPDRPIPDEE